MTEKKQSAEFTKDQGSFRDKEKAGRADTARKTKQKKPDPYRPRDTDVKDNKSGESAGKRQEQDYANSDMGRDFQTKDDTFTEDSGTFGEKKSDKLKKKAEKAGKKAEKAKAKLPKAREYTFQRVFDEETGKAKYKLVPVEMEKPFKEAGIAKLTVRRIQREGRRYVHNKVTEAEKDNSAVEGAHKTEQKAEDVYRFVKNHEEWKNHRLKTKAEKLEKKHFQAEVNFRYQQFLEENPQMEKKAIQKRIQKQRIKREYMKASRNRTAAKSAQEAVGKAADKTASVARKLQEIARRNAGTLVTLGIVAILLIVLMVSISSCGAMFADMQSTVLASSYLSEPSEIDRTDLQFTRLEMDLQNEIDSIETEYPGYDEYSYNLAEIGHDPFTLISYLSAIHTEFTADEAESEVQALFGEMYTLTVTPDTEIRIREVQSTDDDGNPLYDEDGNPVMEEEEYEVSILRVTLTKIPLEAIVAGRMDAEQTEIYSMYGETKGLLQVFDSPVDLYWYHYISSYYGYRKNPTTKAEELHRGLDIAVPAGETVYAAHDGTVTTATYDSHYGNYVVLEKDGYTTKYAHMDSLNVSSGQNVNRGAVIGKSGNTGSSTGSHLHIECLYNGEYYNPLFYFAAGTGTLYGESTDGTGADFILPDSYDDATVQALLEEAAKYLGYPYVWGGSNPSTSFDCSGFVCWVFTNSGVHDLPRTSAQGIYNQCTPVSAASAKPGDIIFFTGTYSSGSSVTHVGIYCGNGVMIHCGDPISYASINSPYWQSHFYGFGRLN